MKRWACLTVVILFGAGCSGGIEVPKLPELVPFEGTVTMDGRPLSGATVFFHPKSDQGFHGASAVTDESGKYVLESDVGNNKTKKGVIPGQYSITISRMINPEGKVIPFDLNNPPMNQGGREEIPMQYATVNDMGLVHDVPPAGGKFDIAITSNGGMP